MNTKIRPVNRHSEEVEEIITAVPSWLLRIGIFLMLLGTALITALAVIIHYPEIVKTQLKVSSNNLSKTVKVKSPGRLIKLLVQDNTYVVKGTLVAYLENAADHAQLLHLLFNLRRLQKQLSRHLKPAWNSIPLTGGTDFGELQASFEKFKEAYISYDSSIEKGYYLQKKTYLKNDLNDIKRQLEQLQAQKRMLQRSAVLAGDDYRMHEKLAAQRVETMAELRLQENNYLAKKSPVLQNESLIINNSITASAVKKELLDLNNKVSENKTNFEQAISVLISAIEDWKMKYTLSASQTGLLSYNGVIQENQELEAGQEIFNINPGSGQFFGVMNIPADNYGKIKIGQRVVIKLNGYPFEEYGSLQGEITKINEVSTDKQPFLAYVSFLTKPRFDKRIHLKQALMANAEIITNDATLFQRLMKAVIKNTSSN